MIRLRLYVPRGGESRGGKGGQFAMLRRQRLLSPPLTLLPDHEAKIILILSNPV